MKSEIIDSINKEVNSLASKIPWSYIGLVSKELGRRQNVLDVGCGTGSLMLALNRDKRNKVTGVDIFQPSVLQCRRLGVYSKVIKQDIRKLNFPEKSFDIVLSTHVIEHLTKKEGISLMEQLEKIAKKKVVIVTPVGFFEQHEHDNNPYQEHHSGWEAKDFLQRGYKVIGQGWGIYSRNKFVKKLCETMGPLNNIFFIITVILHPLFVKKYKYCHQFICVKNVS